MGLNKVKGNMYSFVTHTWNTVKGECPHGCAYCYMKRWGKQNPIRFDQSELGTNLGEENFIFVGSSCDLFARDIPEEWIEDTLNHCRYHDNKYLFQTKNPEYLHRAANWLPEKVIVGTTIETNRDYREMGCAPRTWERSMHIGNMAVSLIDTMVTIEPIMDFDHRELVKLITDCAPRWVNIGANTNHQVRLPEPDSKKIELLIADLKLCGIRVKLKNNLRRIYDKCTTLGK